jgi:NAD(P)-dependent dehydrogenase (short-subunit alcohol dehydrogenase family)
VHAPTATATRVGLRRATPEIGCSTSEHAHVLAGAQRSCKQSAPHDAAAFGSQEESHMIDLSGKVAVVTGGCSGIGRGTVQVLHRAGARVACVDVQDDKGEALVAEIADRALYLHADVTSESEMATAFGEVVARWGGIDVVFNNAGAAEPLDSDPFDIATFQRVQKLLVESVVLGMKYAVPSMIARGGGSIVNTASVAGLQAGYGPFAYSVAKGAVVHLSRVAAAALAKHAIRVNAICPGLIPTAIFGRAMGESVADADRRARDISERAHGFQPIRVAGSPADIGYAVAYFASDLSRFVTGQFLAVDGGLTVGPRQAWDESAAAETWTRIGLSDEQVKKLLGTES